MKKRVSGLLVTGISLFMLGGAAFSADQWEMAAASVGTNITLVTTNRVAATNLTVAIPNGKVLSSLVFYSETNSTAKASIWYGTNSLLQGGWPLPPGWAITLTPPPRFTTNFFGALDSPGSNYLKITQHLVN